METLSHHFVPSNFVTQNLKELAAGLRVYFLQSSSDVAVFLWFFAGSSVSNSGTFSLLLSGDYTESRPSLPLTIPPASGLGGDRAGTADPHWSKGHSIPAYKARGRRTKGRTFRVLVFVFPSQCYMCQSCFPGDCWTCACSWEVANEFLICFGCAWSFCFISIPRLSPFPSFLLHPTREEWESGCMGLSCWLGLNHVMQEPGWAFNILMDNEDSSNCASTNLKMTQSYMH